MALTDRAMSDQDLLEVWETGRTRHPIDRAVLLLAAAEHDHPGSELQRWSIGARDARLLRLRQATFGDALECRATCPACTEAVEVSLACTTLLAAGDTKSPDTSIEVSALGYHVRARLPDSTDLAAIAAVDDVDAARALLLERCVVSVTGPDGPATAAALPVAVMEAIASRMAEADPHAELLLDLTCPACGVRWQAPLDVASLLWAEVSVNARRLLLEVDALARAYGWRESEILALSPTRRATYLELATA